MKEFIITSTTIFVVLTLVSLALQGLTQPSRVEILEREAIQRGVARYHPVTGKWEWTVPLIDSEAAKVKNVEKLP